MQIIKAIDAFDGYKNPHILYSWLAFSGQQVSTFDELYKQSFWHRVRQSDYPIAEGYLDGVDIVRESFHQLMPRFSGKPNTLLVLDPPYLCTHQESYKQARYFDLVDFLRLIHLTKPPYVFFSSTKSEFIRFIDAMVTDKWDNWQTFDTTQRIVVQTSPGYNSQYEDNMVYKF